MVTNSYEGPTLFMPVEYKVSEADSESSELSTGESERIILRPVVDVATVGW